MPSEGSPKFPHRGCPCSLLTAKTSLHGTGDDNTVNINLRDIGESYIFEVIDHGKGIDPEDIDYIWDKYYKKEKNHKRNVVGTGLGLSIVKNILTIHNFKFGVNSVKKQGSTFYFEIPKIKKCK